MASLFPSWLKAFFAAKDNHKELLKYSLFKDLDSHQRRMVGELLHSREYKAGDLIFEAGHPAEVIYFVESGEMELTYPQADTEPVRFEPPEFVGIFDHFDTQKRHASAKAATDLKLLALPVSDLHDLCKRDTALGVKVMRACCEYLASLCVKKEVLHKR
ncbi:MAG: cyclic nucleotide-binding domain-containing protein [Candidatus Cloacimonadaceae bacterium]|nr:cyclic nucleotide-binding domain-containing protein [Candidatus Cloacimonadota bacterium]MDX9950143.1 cyclic nucleotide-binding domain-containing protein [Candidatus Syntrophosphaera sp.]NLN85593.1 cyclic nucleotide-binding domain-containing protein [Candidatus Cloacimonadota bacterium]